MCGSGSVINSFRNKSFHLLKNHIFDFRPGVDSFRSKSFLLLKSQFYSFRNSDREFYEIYLSIYLGACCTCPR